jgi:hypothetical protein
MEIKKCVVVEKPKYNITLKNLSPSKTLSNNYSLNQDLIDPMKSSHPNNFMNKLQMRMDILSGKNDIIIQKKC